MNTFVKYTIGDDSDVLNLSSAVGGVSRAGKVTSRGGGVPPLGRSSRTQLWTAVATTSEQHMALSAPLPRSLLFLLLLLLLGASCLLHTAMAAALRARGGKGVFWHLSDLHLDPSYRADAVPESVCRSSRGLPVRDAGPFGSHMCDSAWRLVQSALENMRSLDPDPDFLVWTGDSPPHLPVKELSTREVLEIMGNFTTLIRSTFPNTPVIPALGNHDYWPQDQDPVAGSELYDRVADMWSGWLTEESQALFRKAGFYTQLVRGASSAALRVVTLNTNLYYTPNRQTLGLPDPGGQLAWLREVLSLARRHQEKVYVVAHVPPGYKPELGPGTFVRPEYNARLVAVFSEFADVIAAHLYGHLHTDCFMVLQSPAGAALGSMFVSPAITPWRSNNGSVAIPLANNPGFRSYNYSQRDLAIEELSQFYLNLTEANERGKASWALEYRMAEAFGLPDLRPGSLLALGRLMLSRGPSADAAFALYARHFLVSFTADRWCQGPCRLRLACAALHVGSGGYEACIDRAAARDDARGWAADRVGGGGEVGARMRVGDGMGGAGPARALLARL
uniref:Acid sphingomyelinase-like phosphodiesterase 3a n=1 Tax=Petromyzon marinus TaxID=7757 RepID=A0AAJ7WUB1_PETMA|nr:acid sphingomyelinase-like phosphodiesterase 3a [Petromyzon marinus]